MAHAIAALSGSTAALLHSPFAHLAQRLAGLLRVMSHTHPYHPERYYMRGPGPAWQAKHAGERGRQPE